jgi:hypothetical protein
VGAGAGVEASAGAVAEAALAACSVRAPGSLEAAAGDDCSFWLSPLVGLSFSVDMNSYQTPACLIWRKRLPAAPCPASKISDARRPRPANYAVHARTLKCCGE